MTNGIYASTNREMHDGIGDTSKTGVHPSPSQFGLTQESEIGKGFGQSGF